MQSEFTWKKTASLCLHSGQGLSLDLGRDCSCEFKALALMMGTEKDVSINLGRVGSPVTSVTMLVISSTWVAHINFMHGEYPSDR